VGPISQRRITRGLGSGLVVVALVTGVYSGEKKSKLVNGRASKAKVSGKLADAARGADNKTLPEENNIDAVPIVVADITSAIPGSNDSAEQDWTSHLVTAETSTLEREEVEFDATAYSLAGPTASGLTARKGMIAADPRILPLGTVVRIRAGNYSGTYCVMDTGGRIRGRKIDIFVPNRREALGFGRRSVRLKILGRASTTKTIKALDKQDQAADKKAQVD
jgi:3D (Asp-Asp-Asp) domain-containing protein